MALKNIFTKLNKDPERVELALVQDIIRDHQIAKQRVDQLANLSAKRERDYREVLKMAEKVGVQMDSKFIEAGKFFTELEQKLK